MSSILCGPCRRRNIHKNAEKWCIKCGEGLCTDCKQSHRSMSGTSDHKLVSIDNYLKIENIPINLKCDKHNKKFEKYCKTHDEAICMDCIPSKHKLCYGVVISLEEAANHAKKSTAFDDLTSSIKGALGNIKKFMKTCDISKEKIKTQKQSVKDSIKAMRTHLNTHLDELEGKLIDELSQRYKECRLEYKKKRKHLKKTKKDIITLKRQTSQLKRFGSDLQVFLRTREINKLIHEKVRKVESTTSAMPDYKIGVEMHAGINTLLKDVDNFGTIKIKENTISLPYKHVKAGQAQMVHSPADQSFEHTKLQFRRKFRIQAQTDRMNVCGCAILPNSHILIADYNGTVIMEYSEGGNYIRDIPVSRRPYDLTVIDTDNIAVSYGNCMEILNLKNNEVLTKETFEWNCWGISYYNKKIYVVVFTEGIQEFDISTKCKRLIFEKHKEPDVLYITTAKDRMYCTSSDKGIVYCCSMQGETLWSYTDESLVYSRGISVDRGQNVFVVGRDSNNLMMIRHDGKDSKTLLTESDGLNNPVSLHYNQKKKLLLVCNQEDGYVFLYSVL